MQLVIYKRIITRFIAVDYQRERRSTRLASDNSWSRCVWSIWARDPSRWIIPCTLERGMPVSREISQAERCALACPPDWARQVVHLLNVVIVYTLNAVCRCLFAWQLYPSCGFSSADYRCFQVFNPCWEIHLTAFVHHTLLTDIFLIKIAFSCEISTILFNFCWVIFDHLYLPNVDID